MNPNGEACPTIRLPVTDGYRMVEDGTKQAATLEDEEKTTNLLEDGEHDPNLDFLVFAPAARRGSTRTRTTSLSGKGSGSTGAVQSNVHQ